MAMRPVVPESLTKEVNKLNQSGDPRQRWSLPLQTKSKAARSNLLLAGAAVVVVLVAEAFVVGM